MKRFIKSSKGFTIIELLIALALFGLVISGGFSVYYFADRTFVRSAIIADIQRDMDIAMLNISNILRNAYVVELTNLGSDTEPVFAPGDANRFIGIKNGIPVIYEPLENDWSRAKIHPLVKYHLDKAEYEMSFSRPDYAVDLIQVTLKASISELDYTYELSTTIRPLNLRKDVHIEDATDPDSLRYQSTLVIEDLEPIDEGRRRCFIATAVFGGDSAITELLRVFRDRFLLTNSLGKSFVDFYYTHSPGVAAVLDGSLVLRVLVGIALLPFVLIAFILVNFKWVLIVCLIIVFMFLDRHRKYRGEV